MSTGRILQSSGAQLADTIDWWGRLGLVLLGFSIVAAATSPLMGYPIGADVDPAARDLAPSAAHWLGTDHLGRDVFSRMVLATRSFVGPAILCCLTAGLIAVPGGTLAGTAGRRVGLAVAYLFTVIASLPRFVLVLLVGTIYGDSMMLLAVAAGVAYSPTLAGAVQDRLEVLSRSEYVIANRAHGLSRARILFLHLVVVGCGRLIGRHLTLLFGSFVVLECTLSYIGGLGVQEPIPSWGNMLVFEWGRDQWVAQWAPAAAIWLAAAATLWASRGFREVRHS